MFLCVGGGSEQKIHFRIFDLSTAALSGSSFFFSENRIRFLFSCWIEVEEQLPHKLLTLSPPFSIAFSLSLSLSQPTKHNETQLVDVTVATTFSGCNFFDKNYNLGETKKNTEQNILSNA